MIIAKYVARYVTLYCFYALSLSLIVFSKNENLIGFGGLILIATSFGSLIIAMLESDDLNRRKSMPYVPIAITSCLLMIGIFLCVSQHPLSGLLLIAANGLSLPILLTSRSDAQYTWDKIQKEREEREEEKRKEWEEIEREKRLREQQEQEKTEMLHFKNKRRQDRLREYFRISEREYPNVKDGDTIADILLLQDELQMRGLIDILDIGSFKLNNELLSQMQQSNPLFYNFKFGIAKNMTSKALIQLYDTWYKLLQMPDYKQDVIQFFTLATEAIENRINQFKKHIETNIENAAFIYTNSIFGNRHKTNARDTVVNTLIFALINNKYQNVLSHYNISILHDTRFKATNIPTCQNIKVDRLNYITNCSHVPLKLYRNLNDPQEMLDITDYIMQYVTQVPNYYMHVDKIFQEYGYMILHEISNLYLEHAIYECILKQDALNQIVASKIHNFHIEINRM